MKKMIKKTSALAISAFMLAQTLPFTAIAGTGGDNYIHIHSYLLEPGVYNSQKAANAPRTGTEDDTNNLPAAADRTPNNGKIYDVYDVTIDTNGNYVIGSTAVDTLTTNSDGYAKSVGLTNGIYWVNPRDDEKTNNNFDNADAFYVELPGQTKNVHVYPKNTDNHDNDPDTTEGKKHTVILTKKDSDTNNTITSPATFSVYFKNALGDWEAATDTYQTTNGTVTITGLPIGQYYFVETIAPSGYLLDQTPVEFNITGVTDAEVQVNYMNDPKLKVGKVISADGAGDTYNWTITADLPNNRANLKSYVITDTFKGITINSVSIDGLTSSDYDAVLTSPASSSAAGVYTITLNSTGLAKLTNSTNANYISADHLTITVNSTFDSTTVNNDGNAVNKAQITYDYGYVPGTSPEPDIPGIVAPEHITEPSPLPADPDPADDSDPTTPVPESNPETPAEAIAPCTFTISNINPPEELGSAKYKITNAAGTADITGYTDINDVAANGNIATVTGLAPGTYQVHQIGVDSAHKLNTTPITIYVAKDGNIYNPTTGEQYVNGTVNNQIQFVNELKTNSFNLPFTGTTATIVFSITGILLMAGTAFFIFIILKKRDDDEEEQENN